MDDTYISWTCLEHEHIERPREWFWVVGVLGASSAIAAFILSNYLFGIFLLIATFTILIYGARKPETIICAITHKGFGAGKDFHEFEHLRSFSIEDGYDPPRVIIATRSLMSPVLHIRAKRDDLTKIKLVLSRHLPEEKHDPSMAEVIGEYFGF